MDQFERKRRNESLAKFLGWYQEKDEPYTWYKKGEFAISVAFSTYNSTFKELPFANDFNYILKVLEALRTRDSSIRKPHQITIERLELSLEHIAIKLLEWKDGHLIPGKKMDLILYSIGKGFDSLHEMYFVGLSDCAEIINTLNETHETELVK